MKIVNGLAAFLLSFPLVVHGSFKSVKMEDKPKDERAHEMSPEVAFSNRFVEVSRNASPAVVFIQVIGKGDNEMEDEYEGGPFFFEDDPMFRFFGAPRLKPRRPHPALLHGSGFFVTPDGDVITNAHVVDGAIKIQVTLQGGQTVPARLVGIDYHADIAVLKVDKINGADFPYLGWADSSAIQPGQWVIAIGSPLQLQTTVSAGVISATGRHGINAGDFGNLIQTDTAANPGSSGGPLIELNGNVCGVIVAIITRSGHYSGITFAIPSETAKRAYERIVKKGSALYGFLGVKIQPLTKEMASALDLSESEGVLVGEVIKDSAADKAGIRHGDIIIACEGNPVKSAEQLRYSIAMKNPGDRVILKVERSGQKTLEIPVIIGSEEEGCNEVHAMLQKWGIQVKEQKTDLGSGIVIVDVKRGSYAINRGIRLGDMIISVNRNPVSNLNALNEELTKSLARHSASSHDNVIMLGIKNERNESKFILMPIN